MQSSVTIWMWLSQGLWHHLCGPRLCTGNLRGRWAHEPSVPSRAGPPDPRHFSRPSTAWGLWTDGSEARALVSFFLTHKAKAEARWEVQPHEEGQRLDSSLRRRGLVKAVTLVSLRSWWPVPLKVRNFTPNGADFLCWRLTQGPAV